MRKAFVIFLLAVSIGAVTASADPLRLGGGSFTLDFEGDFIAFFGPGFELTTT